jgi:hypothetical protein
MQRVTGAMASERCLYVMGWGSKVPQVVRGTCLGEDGGAEGDHVLDGQHADAQQREHGVERRHAHPHVAPGGGGRWGRAKGSVGGLCEEACSLWSLLEERT